MVGGWRDVASERKTELRTRNMCPGLGQCPKERKNRRRRGYRFLSNLDKQKTHVSHDGSSTSASSKGGASEKDRHFSSLVENYAPMLACF